MKFHPFAELFPMLEGSEWEAFKDSIAATKGNRANPIFFRMVDGKKQGLDGRNRLKACKELGVECAEKEMKISDLDVKDFIIRCNVHRRHMNAAMINDVIGELHANGDSIRTIAEKLDIPKSTVARQVKSASGVPNGTPDSEITSEKDADEPKPAKVTGRDGKQYDAKKPTKDTALRDAEGHELPSKLLESFAVNSKYDEAYKLAQSLQKLMDDICKTKGGEHLKARLQLTGESFRSEDLNNVKRDLKFTRPHSVCPFCCAKGKCNVCHGKGWVEKVTWDNADEQTKASLK